MTDGTARERLGRLAERLGILPSYWDIEGRAHPTTDATREALCAALGFDGSTEAAAGLSLAALEAEDGAGLVDPVYVWRQWEPGAPTLRVRAPAGAAEYEVSLRQEDGRSESVRGRLDAAPGGRTVELALPFKPVEGYHQIRLSLSTPEGVAQGEQLLCLAPRTCFTLAEALRGRSCFGLVANLYSVRRREDEGVGDLGTLGGLLRLAGASGGDFVGISPLHALRNRGFGVSPYSPVSRLYRNVIYLDLEAIPELADAPEAQALLASEPGMAERRSLRSASRIDYARVMTWKRRVLEILHRRFAAIHRGNGTPRGLAFERYRAEQGDALRDFATFCTLEEMLAGPDGEHVPFDAWPAGLRDPSGPQVSRFRAENAGEVAFHSWLQFELDRQLGEAAALAQRSRLALGVYQDLAIGLAPDASDVWAFPGLFVRGASVGAPPDDYAPTGQDWGLPPLSPRRLRASAYAYWIRLLRAAFAHSGALRIDHVMGLFRLFWIPAGGPSAAGAYVSYPADDLLGILALESRRHRALVVGEDLGTVPDEVPRALESWGILSSRVLLFEREAGGAFRPSASYPQRAMVTANTHDLPTFAAWCDGDDLALRARLGLLAEDELPAARAERHADLSALEERLRAEGILPEGIGEPQVAELRGAVDTFLCRTPAALAGLSLDDLAGEREPVNVPGVGLLDYPSWSRRMARTVEDLAADPAVGLSLAAAARLRPR